MTTNPKTRKSAPKASAPNPLPNEEPGMGKIEICTLVARWRFLDADQKYQAELASASFNGVYTFSGAASTWQ